jgi:predicted TIM-barrel fold metal-dependent hydrolase
MLSNTFVIDAVVHGYNLSPENQLSPASAELAAALYHGVHRGFSPRGQEQWILDEQRFFYGHNPDMLAHALFAESQTDVAIYHGVPAYGMFIDGGSPLWVGKEIRSRYPGRMLIYGPISPWEPNAVEEVDRLVEEERVVGIKLYPLDLVDGEIKSWHADDPELIYPILERAQTKGIRSIAIHKAIPFGRVPSEPFRPTDIEGAAAAFPNLIFEIVHGGFAYLEETAMMVARFPNVAINLEGTSSYLVNSPRKFAEIIGTMLFWGGADRLIWATGCIALHPRPFLEAFWHFKMPQELVATYGFPQLTKEMKQAILSGNIARILGLDLAAIQQTIAHDEFSQQTKLASPWSGSAVTLGA